MSAKEPDKGVWQQTGLELRRATREKSSNQVSRKWGSVRGEQASYGSRDARQRVAFWVHAVPAGWKKWTSVQWLRETQWYLLSNTTQNRRELGVNRMYAFKLNVAQKISETPLAEFARSKLKLL
jgi:hypothetical protein